MVPPLDDANFGVLISRARSGASDALERILVASIPKIELWNRSWYEFMVRNRLSGRDLTQEVLLIASYSIAQFRGTTLDSWYSWLNRIHRSVVSRLAAHPGAVPLVTDPNLSDQDLSNYPSRELTPGSSVSLNEQSERVRQILERLEYSHRIALLGWMHGMTIGAQATAMKMSDSQIRTLRLKALREFSSLWKNLRESA